MDREDVLAGTAVVLAMASGAFAWWASGIYGAEQTTQNYYYLLSGYSSAAAHLMAAKDAAAASGTQVVAAWVCLGAALVAAITAMAVKSGQTKSPRAASV